MFAVSKNSQRLHIDLASVRDTLLYIESDLAHAPGHEKLLAAIRDALTEIDKLEADGAASAPRVTNIGARFLPVRFGL